MTDSGVLTLAAGPIAAKQELFAFTETFTEVAYLGPMGSGKTRALGLAIIQTAIDYPGARLFLCRDELVTLKKTTLDTLMMMLSGAGIPHELNKNDSIISIPTGAGVTKVFCFGLNTGDYREKLKSFEPFRVFIDEAHAIGEEKLEFAIMRQGRQRIRHHLTNHERITRMIAAGAVRDYHAGMRSLRVTQKELNDRQEGRGYVKYVSNDLGNDWVWNRVVNARGDKPHPDSGGMTPPEFMRWVNNNVGITELFIPPAQRPRFHAGSLARLEDGTAAEVVKNNPDGSMTVTNGSTSRVVAADGVTLVLERLAIYGFSLENQSLSDDNIEGFYYIQEKTRNQYLHGLTDVKTGLMFPMFSPDTHVIEQRDIPESWIVWVGLDYNIDIVTAAFVAENPQGDLVVFDEYEGTEARAELHALEILTKIDHPMRRVKIFHDSSMNIRDALDPTKTVTSIYQAAGLRGMRPATKNREYGIEKLREAFTINRRPGEAPRPKLWVMSNCAAVINGNDRNAGVTNFTWEAFRNKKKDHLMDALRYAIASRATRKPTETKRLPRRHVRSWAAME